MVNNQEVANEFVGKCQNKEGNNFFIDDRTIFSYGKHFPLAIRLTNDVYLVNNTTYSMTTSKHKGNVLRAINGKQIIFMDTRQLKEIYESGKRDYKELIADNIIQLKGGNN